MTWRLTQLLLCLGLLAALLLPARSEAHGSHTALGYIAGAPPSVNFYGVYLYNHQHGWAVGEDAGQGVVYHLWLGQNGWVVELQQRFEHPLRDVVVIAPDNIWAVGDHGLVVHRDAAGWQVVEQPVVDGMFSTIQMFGDGEAGWIGGYVSSGGGLQYPIFLRYVQGRWLHSAVEDISGTIEDLHFAGGTGWAGGTDLWRFSAGAWQRVALGNPCGNTACASKILGVRTISADETWAVGIRSSNCGICVPHPYVLHYLNGRWEVVDLDFAPPTAASWLTDVASSSDGYALAVGLLQPRAGHPGQEPVALHYSDGQWQRETLPLLSGRLNAISLLDDGFAIAVGDSGNIISYGYGVQLPPSAPAQPNDGQSRYFPEVRHNLYQQFVGYWDANGGLPVFGYPLTEAFWEVNSDTGLSYHVQYLERQRFEHRPEHAGTPYEVLLGRLGVEVLKQHGRDWREFPKASPSAPHYFAETGQAIAPEFWNYWSSHGLEFGDGGVSFRESLALFGYPISPPQIELNSSGDMVLTQWFERARFEYHPDNPEPYKVLLGRLAAEQLAVRGWIVQ